VIDHTCGAIDRRLHRYGFVRRGLDASRGAEYQEAYGRQKEDCNYKAAYEENRRGLVQIQLLLLLMSGSRDTYTNAA
jgi:hypothetical protein